MGIDVIWDCEHAKTPDGYYQVRGGIEYAIAKSLAAAPYADILWMETKTADLHEAKKFADAIHAKFPGKMLAYNLSPSFNWDTTGMTTRDAPVPGGARQAGLRLQLHHLRRPPDRRPRGRRVRDGAAAGRHARPRAPAAEVPPRSSRPTARRRRSSAARAPTPALMAISGPHRDHQGDGQGLDAVPAPRPDRGAARCSRSGSSCGASSTTSAGKLKVVLRPHTPAPSCSSSPADPATRRPRTSSSRPSRTGAAGQILSVRDQNTFDLACARSA
jgi:isocitrate lyase